MIYKIAEFTIHTEKLEEAKKLILEFLEYVKQKEPKVLRYESYQDQGGNRFFHFMLFKDRSAESSHQQSAHTQDFIQKLYPLCEKKPVFTTLDEIGKK